MSNSDPRLISRMHRYLVPVVDELLGRSVFYEERRGNLAAARKAAETACAESRERNDYSKLSSSLTALGIVQQLQGDINTAEKSLQEALELSREEPMQTYLATVHLKNSARLRYDNFPDGGCSYAKDTKVYFDGSADLKAWIDAVGEANSHIDNSALALEGKMLRSRWMVMRPSRVGPDRTDNQSKENLRQLAMAFREDCEVMQQRNADSRNVAALRLVLGEALFKAADFEDAASSIQKARETYEVLADPIGKANCAVKHGDWIAAPLSCPEIWNVFLGEASYDHALHWKIEASESSTSNIRIAAARAHYYEASTYYNEAHSLRGQACLELRLGYLDVVLASSAAQISTHYSHAQEHISQAAKWFEQSGDMRGYYLTQAQLALCKVGRGELPEDLTSASRIGDWGRVSGSFSFVLGIGLFFTRIGRRWLVQSGDYQRALACFRLGASCLSALRAPFAHIQSVGDQLTMYEMLGDTSAFTRTAERALDLCSALGHNEPSLKAQASTAAIWILVRTLIYANNKALPDTIARMRDRTNPEHDISDLFKNIRDENQDSQDINALLQAFMAVMNSMSNQNADAASLNNFGDQAMTDFARSSLRQSLFYEQLYRGQKARQSGEQDDATIYFSRAQQVAQSSNAFRLSFMNAMLEAYKGNDQRAAQYFKTYLDEEYNFNRNFGEIPELHADNVRYIGSRALSFFCAIEAFQDARVYLDLIVKTSGENWWQLDGNAWDNLRNVALVEEGTGRLLKAFASYTAAMNLFEERRRRLSADELKVAFASDSTTQSIYYSAARVALKLYYEKLDERESQYLLSEAFNSIERGKARSLLDLMAGSSTGKGEQRMDQVAVRRWRVLGAFLSTRGSLIERELAEKRPDADKIAKLKGEIAKAEAELRETEALIAVSENPNFSFTPDVVRLDSLVADLDEKTALLQYAIRPYELISWAITNKGMTAPNRVSTKYYEIPQQVKILHNSCRWGNSVPDAVAQWLTEKLLSPFAGAINTCSKLIIIPHGALHSLPFQVLPWQGQLIGATHAISYLPSASTMTYLGSTQPFSIPNGVLAVGNPATMSIQSDPSEPIRNLNPLPGAETEATTIARWVPHSTLLTGSNATRAKVLANIQTHTILHFATHCDLSTDVPLLSAIILAHGDALTVYDMLDWDLKGSLVVLSACQTGLGEATAGDDVVGLSRALLAAGAHAVVVSLWKVDDVATSLLLVNFYHRLMNGEPPAKALQGAQNYLRLGLDRGGGVSGVLREFPAELKGLNASDEVISEVIAKLQLVNEQSLEEGRKLQVRDAVPDSPGSPAESEYSRPKYWAPFILVGT